MIQEPAWRQQLFGSFLAAHDVPNGASLKQACRALCAAAALGAARCGASHPPPPPFACADPLDGCLPLSPQPPYYAAKSYLL